MKWKRICTIMWPFYLMYWTVIVSFLFYDSEIVTSVYCLFKGLGYPNHKIYIYFFIHLTLIVLLVLSNASQFCVLRISDIHLIHHQSTKISVNRNLFMLLKSFKYLMWTRLALKLRLQLWTKKCQPSGGAIGKVRGSPESLGFILWQTWMSVQNSMTIHPIVVEMFQFAPKWWIWLLT